MFSGQTYTLKATILPSNATNKNIIWSSSDSSIATISNSGIITAKKKGAVTITATSGNKKTSCIIGIDLLNPPATIPVNDNALNTIRNREVVNTSTAYTSLEKQFLETILAKRISDAGYKTRAGVVAAARFLTLEFKNGISYESNVNGMFYVENEGYKTGLNIKDKNSCWGCKDSSGDYHGLQCSGFVYWVLKNNGFDFSEDNYQKMSKLPNYKASSGKYISSYYLGNLISGSKIIPYNASTDWNKVRVGDLVWYGNFENYSGHIGIIVGMTSKYVYIAQSGVNSSKLINSVIITSETKGTSPKQGWFQIVNMNGVYNGDGKYTINWWPN